MTRGRPPLPPHRRPHGTGYWYQRHLREKTMCDECREWNRKRSKATREEYKRQRTRIRNILIENGNNKRDFTEKELEVVRKALYLVCTGPERKELGL